MNRTIPIVVLLSLLLVGCGPAAVNLNQCADQVATGSTAGGETPLAILDQSDPGATLLEGVEEFEVDGLQVILKQTPGKPVVSTGLYIRGGSPSLTPENAGVESLTLTLVHEGGSTSLTRTEMYRQLDIMGTVIGSDAGRAYSSIGMKAIKENYDRSFEIFADVVMNPAFAEDELERQRTREISHLESLDEDPDTYVSVLGQDLLFEGHPYAVRQWGTVENMKRFTRDDLIGHHKKMMTKSRLLMVIVGDISRGDIEAKVKRSFATLPAGSWTSPEVPAFEGHANRIAKFDKDIPTAYVLAFFDAPAPGSADYYPMVVAMAMLRTRLFEKVRTKLRLSYAVSSGLSSNPVNYGYLYATSSYPANAFNQILDEVESMQDWLVNEEDLRDQVEIFITRTYSALETLSAQRGLLADAELSMGDWRKSAEFIRSVRAVQPKDIRRVTQTYVTDLQIGYYGNSALLNDAVVGHDPSEVDQALLDGLGLPSPSKR